mmetsp:Transcript_26138/g.36022  ORF Transcript_26138/g.36022 Transcript_26138/m.36022 type:complete len:235 (-) Transcript_26138:66-770(-)|eukprot:CAMPEP_0170074842 /NCGR_PEP_ID=MMETSP0019_2-20121128/12086_1 /TAXON_ID=98059 /ORGANISM="Dinobryon sp., Strain UTEXLB2267" /LENGTH=234 /DNA_ID=CAMNT_0010285429 /DNA_START=39 /DNA_END=743 /DNA_ORIENTATION=+
MTTEIEETEKLLSTAVFPGVKGILQGHLNKLRKDEEKKAAAEAKAATAAKLAEENVSKPAPSAPVKPVVVGNFVPIEDFAWDQGSYNSPIVTVYVELDNVGSVKDSVKVEFTKSSFDITVMNLNGKNYRLFKENLEKDIVPGQSKYIVKKDKIVLKLQKIKGEYSYESWTSLTAKKKREETEASKKDPMGGIMDMMKNMYDEGDENMKKIIGEAMMKSRSGEKMTPPIPGSDDL